MLNFKEDQKEAKTLIENNTIRAYNEIINYIIKNNWLLYYGHYTINVECDGKKLFKVNCILINESLIIDTGVENNYVDKYKLIELLEKDTMTRFKVNDTGFSFDIYKHDLDSMIISNEYRTKKKEKSK